MMKLIKMTLVSAVLATSGFATTAPAYIEAGKTITLSTKTDTGITNATYTGELEITENKTLEMQGTDTNAATIAMAPGTTLTVNGKITVKGGCTGQIEAQNPDPTNKPTIKLAPQFGTAKVYNRNNPAPYNNIIVWDRGGVAWYLYDELERGYIDPNVTYDQNKDSFNINCQEINITSSNGESTDIYDLNKNGGDIKVAVNTDDIAKTFGQHFCTTGTEGYPELTLNAVPHSSANLGQMTEGKVIMKFDYPDLTASSTKWPKCDLDLAIDKSSNVTQVNLTGEETLEVPAGKTWTVVGNAPVHIKTNITVTGKLVL